MSDTLLKWAPDSSNPEVLDFFLTIFGQSNKCVRLDPTLRNVSGVSIVFEEAKSHFPKKSNRTNNKGDGTIIGSVKVSSVSRGKKSVQVCTSSKHPCLSKCGRQQQEDIKSYLKVWRCPDVLTPT